MECNYIYPCVTSRFELDGIHEEKLNSNIGQEPLYATIHYKVIDGEILGKKELGKRKVWPQ